MESLAVVRDSGGQGSPMERKLHHPVLKRLEGAVMGCQERAVGRRELGV